MATTRDVNYYCHSSGSMFRMYARKVQKYIQNKPNLEDTIFPKKLPKRTRSTSDKNYLGYLDLGIFGLVVVLTERFAFLGI